mgnify:CR=1 FL=1
MEVVATRWKWWPGRKRKTKRFFPEGLRPGAERAALKIRRHHEAAIDTGHTGEPSLPARRLQLQREKTLITGAA